MKLIILPIFLLLFDYASGQLNGYVKAGVNIGTIDQEWWTYTDSIQFGKPLFRGIVGLGLEWELPHHWSLRQEVFFQIKGQGTKIPTVSTAFSQYSPDILRFLSFPISLNKAILSNLFLGIGFQPSKYLSGSDNYSKKELWRGWIFSGILNIHYLFPKTLEIGFDYDFDFNKYYCIGCESRFYTYRTYVSYHFANEN